MTGADRARRRRTSALWASGWALWSFAAAAATNDVERIEDLLNERWYEIEVIVFERLDVLDVNATEALTLRAPRAWPANLREFGSFLPPPSAQPGPTTSTDFSSAEDAPTEPIDLRDPSPYCLGYPALPLEDPLHPLLAALESPLEEDEPLPLDEQADAIDPDVVHTPVTDEEAPAGEMEPLPQLPTQTTPQLALTPYLQLLADVAAFEAELYATSYAWLDGLTMIPEVKALNRQNHLSPLVHRRWRQPIPGRGDPQPVYLSAEVDATSPLTYTGMAKLEGYVEVTVGRYLHFAPRLWYHADTLGLAPVAFPARSALPPPDAAAYMELTESRRMRSEDLHYLDHPKFGVIVRIDPVTIPESLSLALAALSGVEQDAPQ